MNGARGSLTRSVVRSNVFSVHLEGDAELEIADDNALVNNEENDPRRGGLESSPPPRPLDNPK